MSIPRIQGTWYWIGDSVYIPDLLCNVTILYFFRDFAAVHPHNYRLSVRQLPKNLRIGCGINHCIRLTLYSHNIYTRDNVILRRGNFQVPTRKTYVEPHFRSTL